MDKSNHKRHNTSQIKDGIHNINIKKAKKRGVKVIPPDAKLAPNIPEKDYFSDVSGVYYHFKKMEWRTICKDPFNNSRRWQKTYGINKYGFYQAKKMAETKAHETSENNQFLKVLGTLGRNVVQEDLNNQTGYFSPINELGPRSDTPTDNWWNHLPNNNNNGNNNILTSNINFNHTNKMSLDEAYNGILNQKDLELFNTSVNNNIDNNPINMNNTNIDNYNNTNNNYDFTFTNTNTNTDNINKDNNHNNDKDKDNCVNNKNNNNSNIKTLTKSKNKSKIKSNKMEIDGFYENTNNFISKESFNNYKINIKNQSDDQNQNHNHNHNQSQILNQNNQNPFSNSQSYIANMVPMGGMKGINGTFIDTGSYPYRIVLLDNNPYSQHLNSSVQ